MYPPRPLSLETDPAPQAYELSTLTGTQVLLLVVSETGLVYTFTTAKLQPLVTQSEGKNLIQACLNAPHGQLPSSMPVDTPIGRSANMGVASPHTPAAPAAPPNVPGGLAIGGKDDDASEHDAHEQPDPAGDPERGSSRKRRRASSTTTAPARAAAAAPAAPPSAPPPSAQQQQQGAPPPQQQQQPGQATSPHQRQPMPLPGQLAIAGAQQQQQAQGMPPQSPGYAPYAGGDPNAGMYTGYGGQPPPPPQFNYPPQGHEQQQPGMGTWGGPGGVQQNNHYARR